MDRAKSGTEARTGNQGAPLSLQSMNNLAGSNIPGSLSAAAEIPAANAIVSYLGRLHPGQ